MYYRYWEHSKARPAPFRIRDQRYKLIFYYGKGPGGAAFVLEYLEQ
ncbi:hypothetical protein H9X96_20530 [Pedobacter sp. N36a]|nr:hypothetical protein [Pedobacter sp. N36a]